jgi:hypothetical protein
VSPVKYGLCIYIPEHDILHSHHHENLRSYNKALTYIKHPIERKWRFCDIENASDLWRRAGYVTLSTECYTAVCHLFERTV